MNNLFSAKKLLVVVASCMLSTGALWADVNPKPFVVPELKTWTGDRKSVGRERVC